MNRWKATFAPVRRAGESPWLLDDGSYRTQVQRSHLYAGHFPDASSQLGMLGVGANVPDHVLQKHFQDLAGLLVDEPRDALHTTTMSQAADSRFSDALDVVV